MANHEDESAQRHGLDFIDDVNYPTVGIRLARRQSAEFERLGLTLPQDARYLAIGAGQALAELEFASQLGISQERITLLDRGFSQYARTRFEQIGFTGAQVETDVFSYLAQPHEQKYDLVTALGMEYVFDTAEKAEQLIGGLTRVLNPNATAIIFPTYPKPDLTPIWHSHEFTNLRRTPDTRVYQMLYQPSPRQA